MNYPELKVDEEKCIHCGLCTKECPACCIEMENGGVPHFIKNREGVCIKCQHCLAVCPVGALEIWGKNPDDSQPVGNVDSDDLLNLIKSRRSVRKYKPENLDNDRMSKLKDMLKWTPTGCNFHNLHFSFVDDIEVMDDIRNKINSRLIKILDNSVAKSALGKFASYRDALIGGEDVIFRGAPHMIIVSTPINAPCANEDPIIALSYLDLYAQSLGVGTLWCGFATLCFKLFPDMCEYIGVPDGNKVSYVMLFGVPDVKYARITQPEDFSMNSVELKEVIPDVSILKQIKRLLTNIIR